MQNEVNDLNKIVDKRRKVIGKLKEENKNLEQERDFEERRAEKLEDFLRIKRLIKEYNDFYEERERRKSNKYEHRM